MSPVLRNIRTFKIRSRRLLMEAATLAVQKERPIKRYALLVVFVVSVIITIATWSGGGGEVISVLLGLGATGIVLVVLDVLLVVGWGIQLVGLGVSIRVGRTPKSWYRATREIRSTIKDIGVNFSSSPVVWFGFYLNAFAAIAFGLIAPFAVVIFLPVTMWPACLLFLGFDLAVTVGRVYPQYKYMTARKRGEMLIRTAQSDDIDGYLEAQRVSWGDDMAADRAKLESRFKTFPEGIVIAEKSGRVIGAVTTIRIQDYDPEAAHSWEEITNNGWCNTHDPDGKVMFGVDMSATDDAPEGIHDDLLVRCMWIIIKNGLKKGVLGGRLPGYHKYADHMSAEEYLWLKRGDGKFLDPQVRMYDSVPLLRVVKLLPNYFEDPDSLNNGVLLVWKNPFYGLPGRTFWATAWIALLRGADKLESLLKKFR